MVSLKRMTCLSVALDLLVLLTSAAENSTVPTNQHSKHRSLDLVDRQDISSYQSSYYPSPYPPPTYGPPTPELPPGMVQIEFAFDEIVLRCIAEEPYDHIIWTRYQCPQQLLFGAEGTHVAEGSTVYQDSLYDVHIRGHDGTIVSELLIKHPLADSSEGIYQCEVWPHIHGSTSYSSYSPYQTSVTAPKSDLFIIGGNSLLQDCYHVGNFNPQQQGTKVNSFNKLDFIPLKSSRRNTTDTRKDTNSKQLRYNVKYVDDTMYDVDGTNVTADFFKPISKEDIHNNLYRLNISKGNNAPKLRNNSLLQIFTKLNPRQAKILDSTGNSSSTSTAGNK